jgi:RimJ/RimL family protein N-acetyltransferase
MLRDDDLDGYAELYGDAEVARYIGGEGRALTRAEAWRNMAMVAGHWHLRGYGMWAAIEKSTGAFVGRIGVFNPEGWPGFELGWAILRRYWGQGFATEGARAALAHAIHDLDRDHVISVIHPENTRSIRVAERLGETLEGTTIIKDVEALVYGIRRGV